MSNTVYTVGHSTRAPDAFVALLRAHDVTHLADVRTVPRSRHNPQFNADALARTLAGQGIAYTHFPGLGGFRKANAGASNAGWRNASFRGYADYMQTPAFGENLERLIALAEHDAVAIMCAEAVPWRCHRSLIADVLRSLGFRVMHILGTGSVKEHPYTPPARIVAGRLTYQS